MAALPIWLIRSATGLMIEFSGSGYDGVSRQ
jgi:hypothetical protein